MNLTLSHPLRHSRFYTPAGEGGTDTGGTDTIDRGDDFQPTDDPKDLKAAAELKEAADAAAADKAAEEKAAADKAAEGEDTVEGAEGEDTVEGGDKADKTDKNKAKDTRIPLKRHEELLKKERAARERAEQQLAGFQKAETVVAANEQITEAETELIALEAKYAKLITDGEHKEAATVMGEIRGKERMISKLETAAAAADAEARAYERVRYDTTVERLEAAYPVLNPDHDDYDEDKSKEVVDLMRAYRTMGLAPAAAIQKAAKTLLGVETAKQTDATTVKVKVDDEEVKKKAAEERRKAAVAKNIETATTQPPATKGIGADSDKSGGVLTGKDVLNMPYDKFIKLDEQELKRLRGDVI